MPQCQPSGGLWAESSQPPFAPALFCSQPHCLPPGEAAKAGDWRGVLDGHPTPILHPTLSSMGASYWTAHKGSVKDAVEEGGQAQPGAVGGGLSAGKPGCQEEAWVLSLTPCGARDETVLGFWLLFPFHKGWEGGERQDEMAEGSETGCCFACGTRGRVGFFQRKYKTERGREKKGD